MKKIIILLLMAVVFFCCASTDGSNDAGVVSAEGGRSLMSSDVIGKEWYLNEVYINGVDTQFRRTIQPDGYVNLFTITFGERASGTGSPNRYTAPYTIGSDGTINIGLAAATLMAALFESEFLKEHDFFTYLTNSVSWSLLNGNLELLSKTADGRDVRLVFNL